VETNQFPTQILSGTAGCAKHGIQAGTIPAARENPDAFAIQGSGAQRVDPFWVGRPSEAQES